MLKNYLKRMGIKRFQGDAMRPLSVADTAWDEKISNQGLFIIGAARTGTTILQNALNESDRIFLFGEPGFHRDAGHADFAARYNAMHKAWGNQENKSSYCPLLFDADAPWQAYVAWMARNYRYVGSKIVINPEVALQESRQIFDFHCRHFYRAHYLFTFRHPLDALMSTRGLALLSGMQASAHAQILRSFFAVVQLYIRMLRNLPKVHAVFHETIDDRVFDQLSQALEIPLHGAGRYYDSRKVHRYALDEVAEEWRPRVVEAIELYEGFRREASSGFELIQIEQNNGQLNPHHYTPLGRLDQRVNGFLDRLDEWMPEPAAGPA